MCLRVQHFETNFCEHTRLNFVMKFVLCTYMEISLERGYKTTTSKSEVLVVCTFELGKKKEHFIHMKNCIEAINLIENYSYSRCRIKGIFIEYIAH